MLYESFIKTLVLYEKNKQINEFSMIGKDYLHSTQSETNQTVTSDSTGNIVNPIVNPNIEVQKVEPIRPKKTYTVKSGDTLSQIADKYHISVSKLKKSNGLRSDMIRPGQKLYVP